MSSTSASERWPGEPALHRPLRGLPVLMIDCQGTGATPEHGALLELGWGYGRANRAAGALRDAAVRSHLVARPGDEPLPPIIARLTELDAAALDQAVSPERVWQEVAAAARALARALGADAAPTVIHFARYEERYLRELQRRCEPGATWPFRLICAHQIATRLLPELPRRTLRALAGFFEHALGPARRSRAHVAATAAIWRGLVARLEAHEGVSTLGELYGWLGHAGGRRRVKRVYPLARELRLSLPPCAGVYRLLGSQGRVLYVGKARSLRARVNAHFRRQRGVSERALEMLTQVCDVGVTETSTALEAALLESDEIKRCQPPYNVALRRAARPLWYLDPRRLTLRSGRRGGHRCGPLSSAQPIVALAALRELLLDPASLAAHPGQAEALFGPAPERWPSSACLLRGLKRFRRWCDALGVPPGPGWAWVRAGSYLWRHRHDVQAKDGTSPGGGVVSSATVTGQQADASATEGKEARAWTPARAQTVFEGVLCRAAHAVRRARWLRRLCHALVFWPSPTGARARLLQLHEGHVCLRAWLRPAPSWCGEGWQPAASHELDHTRFDRATFDRLRVLTTELRRLVGEGRGVELWLPGRAGLRRASLPRALRWV